MQPKQSKQRSGSFGSGSGSGSSVSVVSAVPSMVTTVTSATTRRKTQHQRRWDVILLVVSMLAFVGINWMYYQATLMATRSIQPAVTSPRESEVETASAVESDPSSSNLMNTVCGDPATSHLRVAQVQKSGNNQTGVPRILCVVVTTKANHETKVKGIMDTWGPRCDGIVFSSDHEDLSINAVNIKSPEPGIWAKTNATMQYVFEHYSSEDYDWIVKADDDTYLIPDNLRSFLMKKGEKADITQSPMIFGRTVQWPRLGAMLHFNGWFMEERNQYFRKNFFKAVKSSDEVLTYAHGGAGYVMNWKYVSRFTKALNSRNVVHGSRIAEDLGNAVTMRYRNIFPASTINDDDHRQMFHPESPQVMYENPAWLADTQKAIQNRAGEDCCSRNSVSFHHLSPQAMRVLDYQLYKCQKGSSDSRYALG